MDAAYPLLHMGKVTGEKKHLVAGIAVIEWSGNVTHPDGKWTVISDPKSWWGITVFGAIALAKANPAFGTAAYQNTRLMQR